MFAFLNGQHGVLRLAKTKIWEIDVFDCYTLGSLGILRKEGGGFGGITLRRRVSIQ